MFPNLKNTILKQNYYSYTLSECTIIIYIYFYTEHWMTYTVSTQLAPKSLTIITLLSKTKQNISRKKQTYSCYLYFIYSRAHDIANYIASKPP